jgi:hypothetical protein
VTFPHLSCRTLQDPVAGIFDLGRAFDFDEEYASSKIIDGTPTILLNHQIFDVNRKRQGKDKKNSVYYL